MLELVELLKLMVRLDASDVFITAEAPVSVKVNGVIHGVNQQIPNHNDTREFAYSIMNEEQRRGFEETKEANFAIHPPKIGRFRVNVYVQRGNVGLVMRKINIKIPNFEELGLPPILSKICMQKRGLVIMVGGTGTGKSTTQAAMVGYRNSKSHDHIITIEDPIEFLHPHKKSIISQREVGIDMNLLVWHLKMPCVRRLMLFKLVKSEMQKPCTMRLFLLKRVICVLQHYTLITHIRLLTAFSISMVRVDASSC